MNLKEICHILLYGNEGADDVICIESLSNPRLKILRADQIGEAIDYLLKYTMAAIIINVETGGTDTFQTAVQNMSLIRASERFKKIPVIFLFNSAPHPDSVFSVQGEGPVDYILKPVNLNVLSGKIQTLHRLEKLSSEPDQANSLRFAYRQFFDHGPAAFMIIDKHGYIIDINEFFMRYVAKKGYDKLDYIGKHIFSTKDLLHSKILDMCKALLSGKRFSRTDIVISGIPMPDIKTYYSVSGASFIRKGEIDGVILVYEDITDRIEAENDLSHSKYELETANSELGRITENLEKAIVNANKMAVEAEIATISKSIFLASMSHEIRTPLNAVVGFSDLMLSTSLSDEQKDYMEAIHESSQTFLGLINDILDYSKIEANKVELESIPFDLETILDDVITTTGIRAYEKHVEVALRILPDVPRNLLGDPVRIKQILVNLLGNASKFTSQGHILIRVALVSKSSSKALIRFSVSDTGIGIPTFKQDRLFEPFSQVSGSTAREFGGTGLGLAISKRLAALMNGSIDVESPNPESHDNPGAVFHVSLVLDTVDNPSPEVKSKSDVFSGKRALISSGNPVVLDFYCKILSDMGLITNPINDIEAIPGVIGSPSDYHDENMFILIDDTTPDTLKKNIVENIINSSNSNIKIIFLLSPYAKEQQSVNIHGLNASCIKKPLRKSQLKKCLTSEVIIEHNSNEFANNQEHLFLQILPLNILLVEDNKINQKVTTKMLKKMGHTVKVADNGNEAIEMIQKNERFDLIFMDGQMPVMDGFKATEIIRLNEKINPEFPRMPIIALTANAMKGDRDKYLAAGMDDYLAKPVKFDELYTMILKIMANNNPGKNSPEYLKTNPDQSEF